MCLNHSANDAEYTKFRGVIPSNAHFHRPSTIFQAPSLPRDDVHGVRSDSHGGGT